MRIADGKLAIDQEGKVKKLVEEVEQVSFSGRRGVAQGQDVTYVTERCVMKLAPEGIVVTEIAPGVDLQRDILEQSEFPLIVSPDLKTMDGGAVPAEPFGLDTRWLRQATSAVRSKSTDTSRPSHCARPEKLNALDMEMVLALERACRVDRRCAGVRVAILTGEGEKAFQRRRRHRGLGVAHRR